MSINGLLSKTNQTKSWQITSQIAWFSLSLLLSSVLLFSFCLLMLYIYKETKLICLLILFYLQTSSTISILTIWPKQKSPILSSLTLTIVFFFHCFLIFVAFLLFCEQSQSKHRLLCFLCSNLTGNGRRITLTRHYSSPLAAWLNFSMRFLLCIFHTLFIMSNFIFISTKAYLFFSISYPYPSSSFCVLLFRNARTLFSSSSFLF